MMGLVRLYMEPSESLPPQHVPDAYQPVIDLLPEHAQRVRRSLRKAGLRRYCGSSLMAVALDATLSGSTSNSYVDMTEALAIAQNIPGGGEWSVLDRRSAQPI